MQNQTEWQVNDDKWLRAFCLQQHVEASKAIKKSPRLDLVEDMFTYIKDGKVPKENGTKSIKTPKIQ